MSRRELAEGLAELGITRASLGIQDVNPLVQAAIGRLQPLVMVEAAVDAAPARRVFAVSASI